MPKRKFEETVNHPAEITKQSILSEDGALKYDFPLSLQKIAVSKIVTSLVWNAENFMEWNNEYFMKYGLDSGSKDLILSKITSLDLPNTFTNTLFKTFKSVRKSICSWIRYHDDFHVFESSAIKHIYSIKWNSQRRIDYGQTAKHILGYNCVSDEHRYRLACTYCLEDEIAAIAPKVVNSGYLDGVDKYENPMVRFWTAKITGDTRNTFPIESFFSDERHFLCLNEVSMRYVWNKLSADEKSKGIHNIAAIDYLHIRNLSNIICLLSITSYLQQQELFRMNSFSILKLMFNDWLWEDYFLPTALHALDIMQAEDYAFTLRHILEKINELRDYVKVEGIMCNQYAGIFKLLWGESSMDMKYRAWKIGLPQTLAKPIHVDLLEYVLEDFSAEEKKNFIFGDYSVLRYILWEGKIDHFIKYCAASPDEINNFKLMASEEMVHRIRFQTSFHNRYAMALVFKWCSPSKEIAAKLREYVKNEYDPTAKYFRSVLDEFLENGICSNSAGDK